MIRNFISVTKPGIIMGNVITLSGGFFLASRGVINYWLLLATIVGISLIIACGCVINNYIDRDIDGLMKRTQKRVLVKGLISPRAIFIYAFCLGALGTGGLLFCTNILATLLALSGLFVYVVIYTMVLKRNSVLSTVVGSISGAIPPLVGYCAVTNHIDAGAIVLFIMLCLWQVPHSYAIAIFRFEDYVAAKIPVLPVKKNILVAKFHMLLFVFLFVVASVSLYYFGYVGRSYLAIALMLGLLWLFLSAKGFVVANTTRWARQMFFLSILIITILSIAMAINYI